MPEKTEALEAECSDNEHRNVMSLERIADALERIAAALEKEAKQ